MAGIVVKQTIEVLEVDLEEAQAVICPTMSIDSHPDDQDLVVIRIGVYSYTVKGSELIAACDNAMTTER